MPFSSSRFPENGYLQSTPNIQATSGMTGRFNDDAGGVTGYGNAVLTKGVGTLVWEALAYLESIHQTTLAHTERFDTQIQATAQLERKIDQLLIRVAACQEFIESLVSVPAWGSRAEVEMGDDMVGERPSAHDLGLTAIFRTRRRVSGLQDGDVVEISPSPGTLVRRGSAIVITINAT